MMCYLCDYSYNEKNEKIADGLHGSHQKIMKAFVAQFKSAENQTTMIFKHEGRLIYVPCWIPKRFN